MIRKPMAYLVVGYFHLLFSSPLLPTFDCSSTFHGMLRLRWLLEHWERFSLVFSLIQEPLYAGLIGFGLPMLVYASMDKNLYRQGEEQGSALL